MSSEQPLLLSEKRKRENKKQQLHTSIDPINTNVNKSFENEKSPKIQTTPNKNLENSNVATNEGEQPWYRILMYNCFLWVMVHIFDCFFREIRTRGAYHIPKTINPKTGRDDPIIFVAAPHANQFVDPIILVGQVKKNVNKIMSFLIAEKSLHRPAVGTLARFLMSIGVTRPQDNMKLMPGKIYIDPESNNSLKIVGDEDTDFTKLQERGLISLPKGLGSTAIDKILNKHELLLRKEFKMNKPEVVKLLKNGTTFKYSPKIDQSKVYHKVFEHLNQGKNIGIFPEGGSHDRTDLLPLKAGVALMALGAMSKHKDLNVKIVPCGMNYFHPHKFRSRAVVEFGEPIEITKKMVLNYENPESNRQQVKELLDLITKGLKAVTVTCPDYETLMAIQATRRLYSGYLSSNMPLSMIIEMNRRLVIGYETFKNDDRIKSLKKDVLLYNSHLMNYNIPDHQVESAKIFANTNWKTNLMVLIQRSVRILFLSLLSLPGFIMFSPIFIASKKISSRKAAEALANSTVKIKANDVVATWKILIAMGLAPILYIGWSVILVYGYNNVINPTNNVSYFVKFAISYILCCTVTYSALIFGDIGMDTFKSLKPLYLSIVKPSTISELEKEREILALKITELVNTLGPELFPDFTAEGLREKLYEINKDSTNDNDDDLQESITNELKRRKKLQQHNRKRSQKSGANTNTASSLTVTDDSDAVSLINSDNSLSNIPIFSNSVNISSSVSSTAGSISSDFEIVDSHPEEEFDSDSSVENSISKQRKLSSKIVKTLRENRNQT
ncbi:bifunctional glycerol-3-phosphate/glycerone-phosphate O-acyltransferase SCT1 SCDLUD_001476 [Saccharomycodes ludwigii]|uniref:bifunctional glycerol-3-phosphate/glycerone-phosphate O-acyltransferase SCT1 n=1 Tax=Saccharomycodes ludwigii TaxID=36035 RepID=UPI001E8B5AA6|nr:hypothetical protein SCDLUD_001476 [Saccharomycodes ludwigii]KAH3901705.1 hypothetical protein SCDLUD_001476 [Saccharomycodes ludwigii]